MRRLVSSTTPLGEKAGATLPAIGEFSSVALRSTNASAVAAKTGTTDAGNTRDTLGDGREG